MHKLSASAIVRKVKNKEISVISIVESSLKRIENLDPTLNAFLSIFREQALKKAKELDNKPVKGKLAGVCVALKDNMHIKGELTTCASKFLSNYKAPFNATVTELLEKEDAIIIGKTNMDEFAMGSSTENSAFFPTKNPWNLKCCPGGSSGGSAAAVAARLCPIALGSDTGGSIRQPAAFTGVVGFKPTYGRVSRFGLVAFASSLDQIGPLTHNVEDAALIMEVLAKHCERDSTSLNLPQESFLEKLPADIKGMRIGVPHKFLEDLSSETKANFYQSLETLKSLGASIVDIDLDILKTSISVYYIIATAEASTNLARFDGIRYGVRSTRAKTLEEVYDFSKQEGFGSEVKQRIMLGTYVLSSGYQDAFYKKAQKVRSLIIEQFKKAFSECHLICMPTSPFTAFELNAIQDPLQMYLQDIYTICGNLAGLPCISVPSGFCSSKKPFGLQFLGPVMKDATVLQLANAFEKATKFSNHIPETFQ